jgi:two-component system, chemotaxis family, CheB/CheR fusion protein
MPSRRTQAAARPTKRRQTVPVRPAHSPVEPEEEDRPDDRSHRMLIVGIGASAGGLEAFTQLLAGLPLDTGMAFVLVQHLDPDHESALTHILSRATRMPVGEITHNQPLKANQVYVIPRDTNLSIVESLLKLEPRVRTRTPHRPIDTFFESLAQDQRERAIGVVLSGTASDGTLGLEAIKAEGGFTFAQDDSAKYDSMPRSAVAAGCVDLVLSPGSIAKELMRIAKHPLSTERPLELPTRPEKDHENAIAHQDDDQPLPSGGHGTPLTGGRQARDEVEQGGKDPSNGAADGYKKIMLLLRNHSGVDFSLYRSSTIQRRIARRIVLTRQDTLKGYASFLRGNAGELDSLFSDVLISVTSFFRNPEAFDVLQRNVLPKLLAQRGDDPVRCWVLGCSTGQEAYSLAMSFVEAARKAPRARKFQIFATDLNEKLLEKARHGLYAKTLAQDISPERLRQFFVEEDGGYRISKSLREMVVFARQNLIADPPFSRMDLISCRNLLIYLDPSLQQKAMPTFHYALKPHGYLLLGASESVGGFTNLFEAVDRKHKIFSKKPAPTPGFHMPVRRAEAKRAALGPLPPLPIGQASLPGGVKSPEGFRGELNAQREADRIAVSQFAPPGVLINDALQVLQFRGPTGAYLEPPAGKASFDVLKMAREGLMLPLGAAINKAKQGNKTVRTERVRVTRDGVTQTIHVAVIPLKNLRERCFLVVFEEAGETGRAAGLARARRQPAATPLSAQQELRRIAELEADLSETREYLQSIQEQHEAANEELQAANEEVQSANEELQSINEELETSKEELESTNEELTTVNEEMLNRNVNLHQLNNDLANFEGSAKLAILVLGRDLTIRRFSPQAGKQLDLLTADVGRSISGLRHAFVSAGSSEVLLDLDLGALSAEVISELREQEREVRDRSGRWYLLRVRPYMTLDNKVDGAILVLVDIDKLKRNEQAVNVSEAQYRAMFEATNVGVGECDSTTGRLLRINERFGKILGYATAEILGKTFLELSHPDDPPGDWDKYSSVIRGDIPFFEIQKRLVHKNGTSVWTHITINPVLEAAGHPLRAVAIVLDIDTRMLAEEAMRATEERLRAFSGQLEQLVTDRTQELVQSHERLRALGTELNLTEQRHRKRLAGEMHDGLAQWLVICCLNLGRMRQFDLSPKASQIIKETEELLDRALDYSRNLMTELSPPVLQEHGFPAALAWLGGQMQHHGLTVTVEVGTVDYSSLPDDCAVLLFQSVRELLMNALKHAESKEVAIRLFESDGDLCIEVRDEGAGFDLAVSAPSMSSKFGLLSIRERMKALGGRFDLKSSPGAGTTATLVLPLAGSAETNVPSAEKSGEVMSRLPSPSHHSGLRTQDLGLQQNTKIRVLLVDDHAMVRQGLRVVLESYPDVEVVGEAWNGEEAVACVERLQPTIVVMDINMPKMNGIKATAQITSRFPGIIVIGLSVQAGGENEVAMKNAGAAMLLTKESAVDELYRAIRESLNLSLKGKALPVES